MNFRISNLFVTGVVALAVNCWAHDDNDHSQATQQSPRTKHEIRALLADVGVEMIESRVIRGQDVIALPRTAIAEDGGKYYIFAGTDEDMDEFEKWEVTLGSHWNHQYIEAKTGVFPGDFVAVKKSLQQPRQSLVTPAPKTILPPTKGYQPPPALPPRNLQQQPQRIPQPVHEFRSPPQITQQPVYPQAPQALLPQPHRYANPPVQNYSIDYSHDCNHNHVQYYICPHGNAYVIPPAVIPSPRPHPTHYHSIDIHPQHINHSGGFRNQCRSNPYH